jgi:hypothetical protein
VILGLHGQNRFKIAPLGYKDALGSWKTVKYSLTEDGRANLDPSDQNQANEFWKTQTKLPDDSSQDTLSKYIVLAGNNRYLLCHEPSICVYSLIINITLTPSSIQTQNYTRRFDNALFHPFEYDKYRFGYYETQSSFSYHMGMRYRGLASVWCRLIS